MLLLQHFTKSCSKCKEIKLFDMFDKRKASNDGLRSFCKSCKKAYTQNNADKIKEYKKNYNNSHKEQNAISHKRYYSIHAEKYREYSRKRRENNPEYFIQYRLSNKDHAHKYGKAYRQTDIGKAVCTNKNHRRRVRIKDGLVSSKEIQLLQNKSVNCYWCKCSLKNTKTHIDHYVPLSKGGEHTLSNLVVSCNSCNLRKHSKDPIVFANSIGRLL